MSKFVRVAKTSYTLSLTALEEASRMGQWEADLEHLFLALVITEQRAGQVLRDLGINLERARRAVVAQHEAQLSSLGVDAAFPTPGRIMFYEKSDEYRWTKRACDIMGRSSGKEREGDAAAVLRELVVEPSGLIRDILHRLGTTPAQVLQRLEDPSVQPVFGDMRQQSRKDQISGTCEVFVPAPIDQVWAFLADPAHVPDWEESIGSIEAVVEEPKPGMSWQGRAPQMRPDGKPIKSKLQFQRRHIELASAQHPYQVAWKFSYPDAPRSRPVVTEFALSEAPGGTQLSITTSWPRATGWRRLAGIALRPVQKVIGWLNRSRVGSAISRYFR